MKTKSIITILYIVCTMVMASCSGETILSSAKLGKSIATKQQGGLSVVAVANASQLSGGMTEISE